MKTRQMTRGFTLVELLLVLGIISLLASVIMVTINDARAAAYLARAKTELRTVANAVTLYSLYIGGLPADVSRDLPSGLEQYLGPGEWPDAPWPQSVYDWDNWAPTDLDYPPFEPVVQVSIRFCPLGQPANCRFPTDDWASDFDYYSGVYYCIEGPCRSHSDQPVDHPGLCVNC